MSQKKSDPPEIDAWVAWMRAHRYTELSIHGMMHKIRKVNNAYPCFEGLPQYSDDLAYLYKHPDISHSGLAHWRRAMNRLYDYLEETNGRPDN